MSGMNAEGDGDSTERYRYDVFVSYRWVDPDQTWVRTQLAPALRRAGLSVCLDVEDFVPGRDLVLEMSRAGSESRRAICVVSPAYFEGNRMVLFEGLMARRSDPGGTESRLIPFVLHSIDKLPEWIRGLIPVDWTNPEHHRREWRKALKALDAPNVDAPAPAAVAFSKNAARKKSKKGSLSQITISAVSTMVPRVGDGVGFQVVFLNHTFDDMFVKEALIHGERRIDIRGFSAQTYRVTYEIVLDTSIAEAENGKGVIKGTVYDEADSDWGIQCQGTFSYTMSTAEGRQSWEYAFSVPAALRIPARDRAVLRLLFKRLHRKKTEEIDVGSTPAYSSFGLTRDEHKLDVRLESGESLSVDIGHQFIALVANWQ